MRTATVEHISLRASADGAPIAVDHVPGVPGGGLAGDRYANGTGTFYAVGKTGQDLTIVAAEALEAAGITAAEAGRNVVVRGLPDLNPLVGRTFTLGGLTVFADRRCDPCRTLAQRTRPDILRTLAHRGGLRCDILTAGTLRIGDHLTAD
jgi:MOSC domain-containing protein YiiM